VGAVPPVKRAIRRTLSCSFWRRLAHTGPQQIWNGRLGLKTLPHCTHFFSSIWSRKRRPHFSHFLVAKVIVAGCRRHVGSPGRENGCPVSACARGRRRDHRPRTHGARVCLQAEPWRAAIAPVGSLGNSEYRPSPELKAHGVPPSFKALTNGPPSLTDGARGDSAFGREPISSRSPPRPFFADLCFPMVSRHAYAVPELATSPIDSGIACQGSPIHS